MVSDKGEVQKLPCNRIAEGFGKYIDIINEITYKSDVVQLVERMLCMRSAVRIRSSLQCLI